MNADTKALIFLTFDGILAGVLAANAASIAEVFSLPRPVEWLWVAVIVSIASGGMFVLSILLLFIALFPRTKTPAEADTVSPFFFATIKKMGRDKFFSAVKNLTPETIEHALLDQIFANATIATIKLRYLKASVIMIVVAIVLLVAATSTLLLSTVPNPFAQ